MIDTPGIRFERAGFTYPHSAHPVLREVTLDIPEGELCLVAGATGCGKSTLLQLANGLAPHFTGGRLTGAVVVDGRDTRTHPPRDLADIVGSVNQNPVSGFVTGRVDDELAYGMEQLGLSDRVMRTRVEEVVDLLGLEPLRHRPLTALSAGEQQRVAIGAVLTSHPRVLVLDEPTSALDPAGAEEVLAAILRLVHDLGITVLMAEHRLERVVQYADSLVLVGDDGSAQIGEPSVMLARSVLAPPVIELGHLAGWSPLPRSIRDARRLARPMREALEARVSVQSAGAEAGPERPVVLRANGLTVQHGSVTAVSDVDLSLRGGEVAALMGRNGSGKSSLLWSLQGSGVRSGGSVRIEDTADAPGRPHGHRRQGVDPKSLPPDERIAWVALVPQNPSDLLYLDSVRAECDAADRTARAAPGTTARLLERLAPGVPDTRDPRDVSEGERLALVLAIQLAGRPRVLLLDEPTRGLDYEAKRRLADVLSELATSGIAVLLSCHDVEFAARCADRVLVLAGGELLTQGSALQVLTASPSLAPQVARILHPLPLLTVDAVRDRFVGEPC